LKDRFVIYWERFMQYFVKIRRLRLCGLRTITIFWFILSPYALNDIRFEILFIWFRTSRCSLGELQLLSWRAAAPLSASCCSSLGKLLLLSQRASTAAPPRSSSLSELLLLLLSQWAAAAAPLSVSCCCCSSLGELLLLSRRATTPLSANCYSSRRAAALFRSSSVSLLLSLWNATTNNCYSNVMVLLWHKYFFENSYSSLKCSWHHCNL
jgi:hypothetical protein